jgi:hypothetical protein
MLLAVAAAFGLDGLLPTKKVLCIFLSLYCILPYL